MGKSVLFWRRIDVDGLERLELDVRPDGVEAVSTILSSDDGGFRLDHHWRLDPDWRAQWVRVSRWNAAGSTSLLLERDRGGWRLDGAARRDLDGTEEPDLSATPFCNTFPIRRTPPDAGAGLTLDTAYIDAAAMTVERSSQRYVRQGPGRLRYVDLGLSAGFEADLVVDGGGLVLSYEHLFQRVTPG